MGWPLRAVYHQRYATCKRNQEEGKENKKRTGIKPSEGSLLRSVNGNTLNGPVSEQDRCCGPATAPSHSEGGWDGPCGPFTTNATPFRLEQRKGRTKQRKTKTSQETRKVMVGSLWRTDLDRPSTQGEEKERRRKERERKEEGTSLKLALK